MGSRWKALAIAWTAFGVAQGLIRVAADVTASALLSVVAFDVPLSLLWAAATPAVGGWHHAVARRVHSPLARAAAHVPLLLLVVLAHTAIRRLLLAALGSPPAAPFHVTLLFFADVSVASYLAAAWAARMMDAERARAARERRTSSLRAQLAIARTHYLDMQLRPHFLFNALGAITELAHEAPAAAARMLRNVIQLLEGAAFRRDRPLVTLAEELDALRPYLEIQRVRFADWLTIEETAEADARAALVPQFILQPLVENAVHHGLKGRTQRGHIAIHARLAGERLIIDVVDNGVGLAAAAAAGYQTRRGLGLDNVRARLSAIYDADASLTLMDRTDAGTAARLDVPARAATPRGSAAEGAADEVLPASNAGIAASPLRGIRLTAATTLAWGAVALFRIQHSLAYLWQRDRLAADAIRSAIRFDVVVALVWLLLTPVVLAAMRRLPLKREQFLLRVTAHVGLAVGFALGHAALTPLALSGLDGTPWEGPLRELFAWNIAIYAVLLVVAHLREAQRWFIERDASDSALQRELATATFQRTVLELRPDALLGAFRALTTRVVENPTMAERDLAEIGDFLRGTLDTMREQQVTLRDEYASVAAYARVLAAGAEPGLTLRVAAPVDVMDDAVPNGVLRAALDAALEGQPGKSRAVAISASRSGDALLIRTAAESPAPDGHGRSSMHKRLLEYERQGLLSIVPGVAPDGTSVLIGGPR